jgi:acetylglutamate/LysW-gamma-L-alpha-aminoadipate kinase
LTELPKSSAITRLCDPVDMDGDMLRARRKATIRSVVDGRTTLVRDHLSGRLGEVRTELAETLLRSGFVPLVSPPTIDGHDHPVNVDADRVAGGGMALKLVAREALAGGVASARIAHGRVSDPVSRALAGSGTTVMTNSRFGH